MQRRATAGERAAARVVHTGSGSVFHSSYHRFVWSVPFIVSYLYIRAVALFSAHPSPVRLVRFVHSVTFVYTGSGIVFRSSITRSSGAFRS